MTSSIKEEPVYYELIPSEYVNPVTETKSESCHDSEFGGLKTEPAFKGIIKE